MSEPKFCRDSQQQIAGPHSSAFASGGWFLNVCSPPLIKDDECLSAVLVRLEASVIFLRDQSAHREVTFALAWSCRHRRPSLHTVTTTEEERRGNENRWGFSSFHKKGLRVRNTRVKMICSLLHYHHLTEVYFCVWRINRFTCIRPHWTLWMAAHFACLHRQNGLFCHLPWSEETFFPDLDLLKIMKAETLLLQVSVSAS